MFPCTKCGLCCQNIVHIKELKDFDLGDGVCKHFDTKNKSCKIYDIRPTICRIDKMYEISFHKYFTKNSFYRENAKVCNALQEKCNMNEKYKVIIGE